MSPKIYLGRIYDNIVSKLFQEVKDGTLCDEVTLQKTISRKVLSSYYVRISPFSPLAPMGSQISLSIYHEKNVSKLLPEV